MATSCCYVAYMGCGCVACCSFNTCMAATMTPIGVTSLLSCICAACSVRSVSRSAIHPLPEPLLTPPLVHKINGINEKCFLVSDPQAEGEDHSRVQVALKV